MHNSLTFLTVIIGLIWR